LWPWCDCCQLFIGLFICQSKFRDSNEDVQELSLYALNSRSVVSSKAEEDIIQYGKYSSQLRGHANTTQKVFARSRAGRQGETLSVTTFKIMVE
jgi:hypothetical protein